MDLGKFEEHLRATCGSERTVRAYLSDSRAFVRFLNGRLPDIDAVEAWVSGLNHGANRPQTIQRKLAALRRYLGYAARYGDQVAEKSLLILRDYRVAPPVRQVDAEEIRPITREQYETLRERASPFYRNLFAVLWWTGARISEVVGDGVTGIPPLSGADMKALVEQGYVRTQGKGGKRRTLILPPRGREVLREFAAGLDGEAPAFPISPQGVNAALHRYGFDGGAHRFRHAFRARLRQASVSDELMRKLMGHGTHSVTESYGEAGVEELLRAVEGLA